jgi:putative DNA primase/helicase
MAEEDDDGGETLDALYVRQNDAHERTRREGRQRRANSRAPSDVLPPPFEPMAAARAFVVKHCLYDGVPTLRHWRDGFWAWRQSHWVEVPRKEVSALLYQFTEKAVYYAGKGYVPWSPNRHKINDLLEALAAVVILRGETDQPCWLDKREAGTVVAHDNGLLDLERRMLVPHTPQFFNQTAVPFPYDVGAPEPGRWLKFLGELWPQEPEAIEVLQEWFGYVISGRLDMHKILLCVGPTRGGKGVIGRILAALLGKANVCGPTLGSLGNDFGLAPLIGKPLAIISDARFTGRDAGVVVERLLSVSGEDTMTVNRKYRDQWNGKLPTRLHIISNELPKLGDASTAVVGRIVLLLLSRSWLGKEDHRLEDGLKEELPGILNWALEGLQRLTANDAFTRLPSAEDAVTAMRDLASPVGAFVRERCILDPQSEVARDTLFNEYKAWAEDSGHHKMSKHVFGRDLRAAHPSIGSEQLTDKTSGNRYRAYTGVRLRAEKESG